MGFQVKSSFMYLKDKYVGLFVLGLFFMFSSTNVWAQKLILVRHGQATHNEKNIYNGSLDQSAQYSLTSLGKSQIIDSGRVIQVEYHLDHSQIDAVFVSPFKRTQETADILMDVLKLKQEKRVIDPLLSDVFVGDAEGRSFHQFPMAMNVAQGHAFNGENREDVGLRMWLFLMELRKQKLKKDILIISHETPLVQLQNLIFQLAHQNITGDNLRLLNLFIFTPHLKKLLYHSFPPLSGPSSGQKNGEVKVIEFDEQWMGNGKIR